MTEHLVALAARVGYTFANVELLATAMRHRSWIAENDGHESNERLEFLGDAVLGWVVADLVYRRHDDLAEGKLTDLRKSVVNALALAEVASDLGVGECLQLGRGEDAAGGRAKTSILSDALEAIVGAIYLDAGPREAHRVIGAIFDVQITRALAGLDRLDAKTRLQEIASRLGDGAVVYRVTDEGPDHEKTFHATVFVGERELGSGVGRSKKAAEQIAAEFACDVLDAER
jgi:ribonuclease-3